MPAENFWLSLMVDLTQEAPEGPGWYIGAARPGAALIPIQRITRDQAISLGSAFESIFDEGNQPPVLPSQLIASGNALIRRAIDEQLAEAEEQAKRIAKLRRLQAVEKEQETEYDVRRTGDGNGHGRAHSDAERGWDDPGGASDVSGGSSGSGSDAAGYSDAASDGNHSNSDVSISGA